MTRQLNFQKKFQKNNQWTTRGMPVSERFWSKVAQAHGCGWWLAARNAEGYGQFWLNGRYEGAHRVSLRLAGVEIPEGMEVDHLCRNPSCVLPEHLEVVTPLVNQQRGVGTFADLHGKKTHCKHGHEFSPENTYWFTNSKGFRGRQCKTCNKLRQRKAATS